MASTATGDACGTGGSPAISGSSPSSATSTGRVGALLVAGAWVGDWGYYGDIPPIEDLAGSNGLQLLLRPDISDSPGAVLQISTSMHDLWTP